MDQLGLLSSMFAVCLYKYMRRTRGIALARNESSYWIKMKPGLSAPAGDSPEDNPRVDSGISRRHAVIKVITSGNGKKIKPTVVLLIPMYALRCRISVVGSWQGGIVRFP